MIRCDYLVVGAGLAGVSVCEGIREKDRKGGVLLVGNEAVAGYRRADLAPCFLWPPDPRTGSKNASKSSSKPVDKPVDNWASDEGTEAVSAVGSGGQDPWRGLAVRRAADLEADLRVDVRLETTITQFNLERRQAVLSTGQALEFRKACLATGGRAARPAVAGAGLGNVFHLRTLRDAAAVREVMSLGGAGSTRVVVVGGGCLAAQAASLLVGWPGANVVLVHRGRALWQRWLDGLTAAWLGEVFAARGVQMRLGETLNGFEGRTVLRNVQTKSGARIPAAMALVACGVELNLGLVAQTPLGYPYGTPVNEFLETEEKGVFAAGEIAAYPDHTMGGLRRVEGAEALAQQGRVAGGNLTGKQRQRFEWLPHRHAELFGYGFDLVGDFSRPPVQTELEGDRESGRFVVRHLHGGQLVAAVGCNQEEGVIEGLKREMRARVTGRKRAVLR